jgi:hypothetical protein
MGPAVFFTVTGAALAVLIIAYAAYRRRMADPRREVRP